MSLFEILTIIISLAAFVCSIIAIILANKSSTSSNEIALRSFIEQTRNNYVSQAAMIAPLISKESNNSLSSEDRSTLTILRSNFKASVESWLNAYEEACAKYLDKKTDRVRFKKQYREEIKALVESKDSCISCFFDPIKSRYKAILKVYKEWEDLEK